MTSRFAVAKEHAVIGLDELVPELFGGGRRQSQRFPGRWGVANPHRAGAHTGQMSIWRTGARRGAWKDYAGGAQGDAIDLVAYALEGLVTAESRMRALEWIENRFGIRQMSAGTRETIARQAAARRDALAAEEARTRKGLQDRARKFYFSCAAEIHGTVVETYLRRRGIALDAVSNLTHAFRFRAGCDYWPMTPRDGEGNRLGPPPQFPALISAMVSADGTLNACHYTFLEPDGAGKLDTAGRGYLTGDGRPHSAKLMYPATSGYVIRVSYGPSGLSCEEAAERGQSGWLGLTEGIEDALSAAIADRRLRMHAAGSLPALARVPDVAAARGYLVFKDNDWGKPQAQALFDEAIRHLRSFGKPVETLSVPASWGKDVNDALNGEV